MTTALNSLATTTFPSRFNWRRAVTYGPLFGAALAMMETSVLPREALSPQGWLRFELSLTVHWGVIGVVLASATMLLERRLRAPMMAAVVIALSLLVSATGLGLFGYPFVSLGLDKSGRLHIFWSCMFHGGLFVFVYRAALQSERTRQLLGRAEIARQQTETVASEARLLSLQGHVDPAFLLRAMVEIERRYAHDAAAMGRLLDRLVSFLRAAMPGVRSGESTLATEVRLAEQYAQVQDELEPGCATWFIDVEGAMPDLPFPSLLMLPLLDQFAAASGAARRVELRVTQGDGHCILMLARGAPEHQGTLAPELLYRLQVGLRAIFGDDWALESSPTSPAIVLTLPLVGTALAVAAPSHPLPSSNHQEMRHG